MPGIQKTIPCLWYDDQVEEAAQFYTSIFPNSKISNVSRYGKQDVRYTKNRREQ
jgi:predicted 3-demethylubiquinone-9 3-methyltransferase (glyoxalase superfamily)